MFIDRVKVHVKAGKGGDGIVAFRHEKYVAYGGPSGGDGGDGGNVVFVVDEGKTTLLDLRYHKNMVAQAGGKGKTKKMHGAAGDDLIIKVPQGTLVKDGKSGRVLADLTRKGQREIIALGGKKGRGNFHFKSSKNTAPQYCEKGAPGEEFDIQVELKVLADVGLVGYPSVGKSTLLSVVSKAKPVIADYPFTTLAPNLGMVQVSDGRSFVMADLPGLIAGASEGKGLGHQFLRHIERCRVILHVLDMGSMNGRDPREDYKVINDELRRYTYRLLERPQIVIANKMDIAGAQENVVRFKEAYPDVEVFETTTIFAKGVEAVIYRAAQVLETTPQFPLYNDAHVDTTAQGVLYTFEAKQPPFTVHKLGNGQWALRGDEIERRFLMSKLDNEEDYMRFARKMRVIGIDEELRKAGCQHGDTIVICNVEFEFVE